MNLIKVKKPTIKQGSKMARIMAAARLIRRAENVSWSVALSWSHQAWREYEAKQAQLDDGELTTLFSSLTDQPESHPADPAVEETRRLRREERRYKKDEAGAWPKGAEAKWQALEARAAHLQANPAAKRPARVVGPRVYSGVPKSASQRALARRQKAQDALPHLLSAEESRRLYGAKRKPVPSLSTSKAPAQLGAEPRIAV